MEDTTDFDSLSDEQLRRAQAAFVKRLARKSRGVMAEAMKGHEQDVLRALTTPPFVYTTPDIKIAPGLTVKMQSLNNDQVVDAYRQIDQFLSREDANNLRVTNELNQCLVSHSLARINGSDFGGVAMPENYHELVRTDPDSARRALVEVREKRRAALGALPMPITQRLVEFYLALQVAVDGVANNEDIEALLGN